MLRKDPERIISTVHTGASILFEMTEADLNDRSGMTDERTQGSITESNAVTTVGLDFVDHYELDGATCLYLACLDAFKILCRDAGRHGFENDRLNKRGQGSPLKSQLERFYLWGERLRDGSLDKALEHSKDLRITVLTLLCDISRVSWSVKVLLSFSIGPLYSPVHQSSNSEFRSPDRKSFYDKSSSSDWHYSR